MSFQLRGGVVLVVSRMANLESRIDEVVLQPSFVFRQEAKMPGQHNKQVKAQKLRKGMQKGCEVPVPNPDRVAGT